jgi:hypothetical protein
VHHWGQFCHDGIQKCTDAIGLVRSIGTEGEKVDMIAPKRFEALDDLAI